MADDEDAVLVCERVADMPIPYSASDIKVCTECVERVWVSWSSPQARVVCRPCVVRRWAAAPDEMKIEPPTAEQWAEVQSWLDKEVRWSEPHDPMSYKPKRGG